MEEAMKRPLRFFVLAIIFLVFVLYTGFAQQQATIAALSATSELRDGENPDRYSAMNAFDGDPLTAWVEGKEDAGIAETITLQLDNEITFDHIEVMPGFFDERWWSANNRVRAINIGFHNGSAATLVFSDEMTPQKKNIGSITTTKLTFKILEIFSGTRWNDTCIAEIRLYQGGERIDLEVKAYVEPKANPGFLIPLGSRGFDWIDFEGGQRTRISSSGRNSLLSPDWKWIAFIDDDLNRRKKNSIYIADTNGSNIQNLTEKAKLGFPEIDYRIIRWSSDSRALVCYSKNGIYAIDITSGKTKEYPFPDGGSMHAGVSVSPDFKKVAFSDFETLFISDIDGENREIIASTNNPLIYESIHSAYWSPDGEKVAFLYTKEDRAGIQDIAVVNLKSTPVSAYPLHLDERIPWKKLLDATSFSPIGNNDGHGMDLVWSPDSKGIVALSRIILPYESGGDGVGGPPPEARVLSVSDVEPRPDGAIFKEYADIFFAAHDYNSLGLSWWLDGDGAAVKLFYLSEDIVKSIVIDWQN